MKTVFTANQFTPTKFDTAEDKARFANHFVRFIEKGFPRTLFPKWFYRRLSSTFRHTAHYNIDGFYGMWFGGPERQQNFLQHTRLVEIYGDPAFTYSDVEKALQNWAKERMLLAQYCR